MKKISVNLIVGAALLCSGAALAAGEMESKTQSPAVKAVTAASAVLPASATEATPPAAAQKPQPTMKHSTSGKHHKAKLPRSKSLDLRHCLELETNIAIAKCAGE